MFGITSYRNLKKKDSKTSHTTYSVQSTIWLIKNTYRWQHLENDHSIVEIGVEIVDAGRHSQAVDPVAVHLKLDNK